MSKVPVKPDGVPVGNVAAEVRQFPLPSLRDFMLPDQLVLVQSFEATSLDKLDQQINAWIRESSAIVAIPSPVNCVTLDGATRYMISMTYLQAVTGNEHVET